MKQNIEEFLKKSANDSFLTMQNEKKIAKLYNMSLQEVENIALKFGVTPLRYKKNQSTISIENQLKLLNAHVSIIGCGGLGGHVGEILTRIGVGNLKLFDFDIFEEHNLNRQNFSNYNTIGREKTLVTKEALELINPAVHVEAFVQKFNPLKDMDMIKNSDVVVDALDNPKTKLLLASTCKKRNIAFVHGAIAGMVGQFSTCNTLENLYRNGNFGIEGSVGNPSFSVSFAASIQSAETIKTILKIGKTLKNSILITNLLENEFIIL
ncbi:MAG: ThiF family adenylyltransferase [Sulfurospirillum sp.]|nr:ThiF family adenylyltransferase [Sulfurospirillum sp.]MBL0702997.1 ThiF family adenylyltransferase [Sulfurospirillum sp.]